MAGTTVPIKEECPKTRRKKKTCISGRLHFDWADGGIRATDAPNRYVPTSGIAENTGGGQRNTGIGYGEGGTQTPRTGDNDCDVGTYRQVRPTFPKRTDANTMNGSFHIERCQKTRRKKKTCVSGRLHFDWADGGIRATDAPGGTSLHLHRGKRPQAVNGIQG